MLTVEPAGDDTDFPFLLALIQRAFAHMDGRIDPPSSLHRMNAHSLAAKAHTETLLLARMDGAIVGCMFCAMSQSGTHLHIGKAAVSPHMQGRGVGRALFERAFMDAREQRLQGLELETRIELTENHAKFAKFGFQKVGEVAHEGYDRPTSIIMRAGLDQQLQ